MFLVALACGLFVYGLPVRLVNARGDFASGVLEPLTLEARNWKIDAYPGFASDRPINGLILGSSRSMKIRPETLAAAQGGRWFNFSVDNAKVEDYLAIYRWARANGPPLHSLLIGLDIEALNDDDVTDERFDRNVTLRQELAPAIPAAAFLERLRVEIENDRRMYADWYARDTLRSIQLNLPGRLPPPRVAGFEADGYLQYLEFDAQRQAGTFNLPAQIAACIPSYVLRFSSMRGLSAWRQGLLEQLLRETRADGVAVTMWLTPVHPATASALTTSTGYVAVRGLAVTYLFDLRSRFAIRTFDFSDPAAFGATAGGWYDCAHIDAINADLLTKKLLE